MVLLCAPTAACQQWSSDPLVDRMKKAQATILAFEELKYYCERHPHDDKECDGINDHIPTTYMDYDDALKLGKQQLEEKAKQEQAKPQTGLSLGEVARQLRLRKQVVEAVRDFCAKNATVKFCKEKTPAQVANEIMANERVAKEIAAGGGQVVIDIPKTTPRSDLKAPSSP